MTIYSEKTCAICGETFLPNAGTQKYCSSCRWDIYDASKTRYRAKEIAERKKRVRKQQKEMSEIIRKCEAAGLSYGEAVAKGVI